MLTIFTVFTNNGTPQTGLSPTIDVRDASGSLIVTSGSMVEVGGGGYKYDFVTYSGGTDYIFIANGGATLPIAERYKSGSNELAGVWEELKTEHTTSGTFGESVNTIEVNTERLRDVEEGNWAIVGTQMIFYDRTGSEILRYNLKDQSGTASNDDVFSRVKV